MSHVISTYATALITLILLLIHVSRGDAQRGTTKTSDTKWLTRQYTNNDGLKQMEVEDIHFSKYGLIWIATRGGVCTFDGKDFDKFDDFDNKPISAKKIEERANGDIIIDAGRTLYVFNGKIFTRHVLPEEYVSSTYSSMVVDWNDNIWLQNNKSKALFVFKDSIYSANELFDHSFFKETSFIIPDNKAQCYYGIQEGRRIVQFCDGKIKEVHQSSSGIRMWKNFQLSNNANGFRYRDIENAYMFYEFATEKVYSLNPASEDVLELIENDINVNIHDGILNKLWVSESNELITLLDGIQDKYNHYFCYERHGNTHYIGTGKGLIKMTKSPFTIYSEEEYQTINFIRKVGDDTYFGSYGDGLISLSNQEIEYIPKAIGIEDRKCHKRSYYHPSLIGEDSLVVPTEFGVYLLHDYISTLKFPEFDELQKPVLFTDYDANRGYIILSMCPGVYILNKQFEVVKYLNEELIMHRCMRISIIDNQGHYWLGGSGGVSKYDIETNQLTQYASSTDLFPIQGAVCGLRDQDGRLWFGSRDGLCFFNEEKQMFQKIEQLKNYSFSSMIQTDSNKYLLNTLDGLMMADLSDYSAEKKIQYHIYTESNGFEALEPGQNGLYQDDEGLVWTTSATNVISFDPDDISHSTDLPSPYIKSINGQRPFGRMLIELEHGQSTIKVDYGVLGNDPNDQYIYRLKLNNDEWSAWTKERSRQYQGLGSNQYQIKLQAKPEHVDDENLTTAEATCKVSLPLEKEPYFSVLMLSLLFCGGGTLFWLYLSRKNQKVLNQVLNERNELLADKNDMLLTDREELIQLNDVLSTNLLKIKENQKGDRPRKIEILSYDKSYSINPDQILYLQSNKKITKVSLIDKPAIWSSDSLKSNYRIVEGLGFIQIQRSTVINTAHIKWINTNTLKMDDGKELKIGRSYKTQLKSFIENMKG